MASIISAGTTSGTSLNLSADTSGVLQLATNGTTTAVTIDTSQNVGIGSSAPTGAKLDINGGLLVSGALSANQTSKAFIEYSSNVANFGAYGATAGSGEVRFSTGGGGGGGGTERMRINSSGQIAVGASSNPWSSVYSRSIYLEGGSGKTGAIAVATSNWTGGRITWVTNNAYTASDGTFKYASSGGNGVGILALANDGLYLRGAASGTADTTITTSLIFDVSRGNTFALEGGNQTAGVGIAFPSTQSASSDANTLDDYEEGTWTPTFRASGSALSSVTYTVQTGRYTKIGRTVFIECYLRFTAYSGGSGSASVSGLPFTSASSNFSCMAFGETAGLTVSGTYYYLGGEVDSSSTNISLLKSAPSSSTAALALSDVGSATTVYFIFSGTYTASA